MILGRALSAFLAISVTGGLFYLMQALISRTAGELQDPSSSLVDFVRLKRDSEPELKKRQLPKKEKPQEPPPPPDLNLTRSSRPDQGIEDMQLAVPMGIDLQESANIGAISSDGDVTPVVRVNPQYPARAAEQGIEGWVELEFTVTAAGAVQDAVVIGANPRSIFDKAALRAVRKWKYNPKIEDGKPVPRTGVRVRLAFRLADA